MPKIDPDLLTALSEQVSILDGIITDAETRVDRTQPLPAAYDNELKNARSVIVKVNAILARKDEDIADNEIVRNIQNINIYLEQITNHIAQLQSPVQSERNASAMLDELLAGYDTPATSAEPSIQSTGDAQVDAFLAEAEADHDDEEARLSIELLAACEAYLAATQADTDSAYRKIQSIEFDLLAINFGSGQPQALIQSLTNYKKTPTLENLQKLQTSYNALSKRLDGRINAIDPDVLANFQSRLNAEAARIPATPPRPSGGAPSANPPAAKKRMSKRQSPHSTGGTGTGLNASRNSSSQHTLPEEKDRLANDYDAILENLNVLRTHIFNQLLDINKRASLISVGKSYSTADLTNLLANIDRRIKLLNDLPKIESLKARLDAFETSLQTIHPTLTKKIGEIPTLEGHNLDGESALEQFTMQCQAAIDNIKQQKEFQATITSQVNVKAGQLDPGESLQSAYNRLLGTTATAPSTPGSAAGISAGHETTFSLTEKIKAGEVRACQVKTDLVGQQMGYIESLTGHKASSTVMQAPDRYNNEKIWEGLHGAIQQLGDAGVTPDHFKTLYQKVMERHLPHGKDSDLKHAISLELQKMGVAKENAIYFGNNIAELYLKERDNAAYQQIGGKLLGVQLPCDDLIRLAFSQIDGIKKMKPNDPIIITSAFSEAYVKAMLHWAEKFDLKVVNDSQYKNVAPPTSKEAKAFESHVSANKESFGMQSFGKTFETERHLRAQQRFMQEEERRSPSPGGGRSSGK